MPRPLRVRHVALLLPLVLVCLPGCVQQGDAATIRAYTGTQNAVLVKLEADDASGMWILPGHDDVQLVYTGHALKGDVRLVFLDATTCAVLGTASSLPPHVRVGLDFVDPTYAVTVSEDNGGVGETIHPAVGTSQCPAAAIPSSGVSGRDSPG